MIALYSVVISTSSAATEQETSIPLSRISNSSIVAVGFCCMSPNVVAQNCLISSHVRSRWRLISYSMSWVPWGGVQTPRCPVCGSALPTLSCKWTRLARRPMSTTAPALNITRKPRLLPTRLRSLSCITGFSFCAGSILYQAGQGPSVDNQSIFTHPMPFLMPS